MTDDRDILDRARELSTCPSVARAGEGNHVHVCELPADHISCLENLHHVCGDCGVSW